MLIPTVGCCCSGLGWCHYPVKEEKEEEELAGYTTTEKCTSSYTNRSDPASTRRDEA